MNPSIIKYIEQRTILLLGMLVHLSALSLYTWCSKGVNEIPKGLLDLDHLYCSISAYSISRGYLVEVVALWVARNCSPLHLATRGSVSYQESYALAYMRMDGD